MNLAEISIYSKTIDISIRAGLDRAAEYSIKAILLQLINEIIAAGRFDFLQEALQLHFPEESFNTQEDIVNTILASSLIERLKIIEIIIQQCSNARIMAKACSLTSGILLPNITDDHIISTHTRILDNEPSSICPSPSACSSLIDDALTPSPTLLLSENHQTNGAITALDDSNDEEITGRNSKIARRA
ncbi:hypothetical protein [Candidatus Berkiella aquae]|uniref:Uncharacterized protein n=1 Tax=Candidatus Berkiella aquae TaxID=295108 RepID=A0A0Q9YWV1_9GAMM|nr:hypothetical protein [Candidatus Berkiella aquae]MCS5711211.1 hypothetical protein [Candidatus Berkiella aquae]